SKIGARTWIEVSHPRGFSGYTAAWLFKIVEDTGESTAESDTDTSADPVDTVSVQADKSAQDTPVDDNETTPEISQERVVTLTPIGTQGVNIRSAASTSASVVGGCASNEIVTLVNSDDASKIGARTWIEVSHPKGFSGHTAAWLFKVVEDKLVDIPGSEIDTSSDAETPSTEASAPETDSTADTASTTSTNDERMAARERARSVGNNQSRRSSANASDLALDTSDVSDPLTSDAVSAPVITTQAPAPVTAPVSQTSAPEETASALSTASDFDTGTTGVNLDLYHPLGTPDPAALGGIKWVRFLYNVSMNPDIPEGDDARYGNTDLAATMSRYRPVLEKYAHAKKNIVLVFTHQTYGEGQGLNLGQLDDGQWRTLSDRFAEMVAQIAEQYKDSGIIHALQIWNEQDAHEGAVASIPLRPAVYGYMLGKTIQAVREVDSEIPIITGGHASGPGTGVPYAKATIAAMPDGVRPSGIAFHPYGRGNMKSLQKYRHYGNIDESINSYASVLPDTPLWITEWGVLDAPQSPPEEMGAYAQEFMERVREAHTG
ncbi:MAG: SH3 domain-containing protein, partial [Chloroflexota bacterium]